MRRLFQWSVVFTVLAVGTLALPARAEVAPEIAADALASEVTEAAAKPDVWNFVATVGSSVAFGDNRRVVGQPTGSSWLMGLQFFGGAYLAYGRNEWRNELSLKESFSRTPVIPEFVKASDEVKLDSVYIYRFLPPWLGVFGRFGLATALLEGKDVRPTAVDYLIPGRTTAFTRNRLKLTDPFKPFNLKESIGLVYTPIAGDLVTVEARAGFGGRHSFADGQLVLADKPETVGQIEIGELSTVHQAGAEATLGAWGSAYDKRVTYKAQFEAMTPVVHSSLAAGDDRNAAELTNIDLLATLSFKLVSWASLDYQFKVMREPQVLDEWQLQNSLLLTFSYSLVDTKAASK
jgi:hypothetical protein